MGELNSQLPMSFKQGMLLFDVSMKKTVDPVSISLLIASLVPQAPMPRPLADSDDQIGPMMISPLRTL
jgi:hypothetical protein